MARPQKSTKDAWLDQFADWPVETQESMMDVCDLLHRQTKRRAGKTQQPANPATTAQPSLSGLPEDQR